MNYNFSEEALKTDHSYANSANSSPSHAIKMSQAAKEAFTNDYSNNAKMTSKPASKSQKIESPKVKTGYARGFHVPTKTSNQGQGSGASCRSDSLESTSAPSIKPHTGGDIRWDAINMASRGTPLNLNNFRLLKRVGYGDIGSVYLVELKGTRSFFAMKVMDKASLASKNKLLRTQTEREILGLLDHPFCLLYILTLKMKSITV